MRGEKVSQWKQEPHHHWLEQQKAWETRLLGRRIPTTKGPPGALASRPGAQDLISGLSQYQRPLSSPTSTGRHFPKPHHTKGIVWGLLENFCPPDSLIWRKQVPGWWHQVSNVLSPQMLVVQSQNHVQLLATPWPAACWASPSFIISQSLLKLRSIELVMLSHPLLPSSPLALSLFPASASFQMSQFFTSGGQRIGASASASVLPMTIQDWFPLGWTGWLSLQSKGLSRVFSNTTVQKHQFFSTQPTIAQLSHPYMTTGKTIALTRWAFVTKVTSLLFNMLFRFVSKFPRDMLVQSKGGAHIPA